MNKPALFLFCFLSNGCGNLSASITSFGTDSLTLVASKTYSPDVHSDASHTTTHPTAVTVPAEILVTQGNAGTFNMSLFLGSVTCTFVGASAGSKYTFTSCDSGHISGQAVNLLAGEEIRAHVNDGDSTEGPTQIQIRLNF
ncbi:hypothetical protein D3C87_123980 [compost metagenome]